METERRFRVVIFTRLAPYSVMRLICRIHKETPEIRVCGVLYEDHMFKKPLSRRVRDFVGNLRDPAFVAYAMERIGRALVSPLSRLSSACLRFIHGAGVKTPEAQRFGLTELAAFCANCDCELFICKDMHEAKSLQFVQHLHADLGLVYSTRILKPQLYEIPHLGSINIHKRKLPEYRGGGPIGLWELLDNRPEIGITVHRVAEAVDVGGIVNAVTIPIEPFDSLDSLDLKADVIGNDLIIKSIAQIAHGTVKEQPQTGTAKTYRNPQPHVLRRLAKRIAGGRPRFRMQRRSAWKLFLFTLALLPYITVRNWILRIRGTFPIVVFYHHLVTNRPHCDGVPMDVYLRHVRWLQEHYRVVDICEAMEMLKAGRVDRPTVVLTLDDGYRDNYLGLRAITEATGVPVTLFVCTQHVEHGREFDHDLQRGQPGFSPLTWEQVRILDQSGFRIGSHTRSHFDCGSADPALLESEIVGSKADLEKQLGHGVSTFSFPWGLPSKMSPPAIELAKSTYTCVCSAYGGANYAAADDRYWHIKRFPHPDSLWELELTAQTVLRFDIGVKTPVGPVPGPGDKDQIALVSAK
jgi:peptidoglycan/xylan/chitin deacetylase (PgdA/CDA1 family)/folate-dependent phosphoribosylglycinamide formyltransferase PurN